MVDTADGESTWKASPRGKEIHLMASSMIASSQSETVPEIDRRLCAEIESKLRSSGHHALRDVRCTGNRERLLLTGVVPTYYSKQVAQTTVLEAAPGTQVKNLLEVTRL